MSDVFHIGEDKIPLRLLPDILDNLNITNLLIRRYLESKYSSKEKPTREEQIKYQKIFFKRIGLTNTEELKKWLKEQSIDEGQMSRILFKSLQLELFKVKKFSDQINPYYLDNKDSLDKVSYSLIRVTDKFQIQELFTRLQEEDSTFSELASKYSLGHERNTNGFIGPVELGKINPKLSERLRISKADQLWPPFEVDNFWVILRFERRFNAELKPPLQKRILDELYEKWINDLVLSSRKQPNKNNKTDMGSKQPDELISELPKEDTLNPLGSFLKKFRKNE